MSSVRKSFIVVYLLLALVIIASMYLVSCASDYKKVEAERFGCRFSFEYPISLNDSRGTLKKDSVESSIFLYRPPFRIDINTDSIENIDTIVSITTFRTSKDYPSAQDLLSRFLTNLEKRDYQFELFELKDTSVDGIPGELAVYKYLDAGSDSELQMGVVISRKTYLSKISF
jgi:hypothetical protein